MNGTKVFEWNDIKFDIFLFMCTNLTIQITKNNIYLHIFLLKHFNVKNAVCGLH